jgi:hypothetical protein
MIAIGLGANYQMPGVGWAVWQGEVDMNISSVATLAYIRAIPPPPKRKKKKLY